MVNYLKLAGRIINKNGNNPVYLIHFITSKCTAKCSFCFYWKNLNQAKNELSFEEIDKVTRSFDKDLFHVILTGGEPYLRKDLADIKIAYHKNAGAKNIGAVTTGFFTKKTLDDTKKVLDACPKLAVSINLSINGLYHDMDNVTKLKNNFEKFLETYNGLVELKRRYKNLGIYTITTHSGANQEKLNQIYEFIKENMPEAVPQINLVRGEPKDVSLKEIDISKYEEISERMKEDRRYNDHSPAARLAAARLLLRNDIISNTFKENKYSAPCYAAALQGVLYEEGDVFCCELLDKKMGNVREHDYDIKKIWNSKKADEIRRFIRETNCFCTHECFYTTNIMFNPRFYPKLLKESVKFKSPVKEQTNIVDIRNQAIQVKS